MTNKEITKVVFNNSEISALYYGDVLIWKKGDTAEYGVNTFAGKFTDDSTESDWYWEPNKKYFYNTNKISISDKVDPTTKEFNFEYVLNNAAGCLNEITKIEKIYHFPDTSNVTSMHCMFRYCNNLSTLNISNFNTSKVTDMGAMFMYCRELPTIDVSSFNTERVTDMSSMFYQCKKLTSLDLDNFNTSKVTNMNGMFYQCVKLATLNLGNFNTSKVTDMSNIFGECQNLTTVTGVFEGTKDNLYLYWTPLTNASVMIFINGLANVTETKTITLRASTYNTLTPEQIAVATSKGWTVISA